MVAGIQLHELPERLRVFDLEAVDEFGKPNAIAQFQGTFHGTYFRDLVRCSIAVPVKGAFRLSFAPMYESDTLSMRSRLAATLRVGGPQGPTSGKMIVTYERLMRVSEGSYAAVQS